MKKLYLPRQRLIAFYVLTYWGISCNPIDPLDHRYLSAASMFGTRCDTLRRRISA